MAFQTVVLNVEGMSCQHCVMRIKKIVGGLAGVSAVSVDLKAGQATVDFDPGAVTLETIREAIEQQGYEVR